MSGSSSVFFISAVVVAAIVAIALVVVANADATYMHLMRVGLGRMKRGCLRIFSSHDGRLLLEVARSDAMLGEMYTRDFPALCKAVVKRGDTGLGEEYMRGNWTSPNILNLLTTLVINDWELQSRYKFNTRALMNDAKNVQSHYDAGNDFYLRFLRDDLNAYTCGFYLCKGDTLNSAQYNKVNAVIKKLEVEPGMRVLDVGCGWGKIADYVGDVTKSRVDGVTIAQEQVKHIRSAYPHIRVFGMHFESLPSTLNGQYDRIYSIGIIEHVRCPKYVAFMKRVHALLKPGGRLVLHTITFGVNSLSTCGGQTKTFITEHIFPGGQIPERKWIVDAAGQSDLKLVHMEVYGGQHYGRTLVDWMRNMLDSRKDLNRLGYDDAFIRKYEFYMAECAAAFYADRLNITHFVYDKIALLTDVDANFQCLELQ
jgi:cyclopropane-fatty-acyl-phospholipid synthase